MTSAEDFPIRATAITDLLRTRPSLDAQVRDAFQGRDNRATADLQPGETTPQWHVMSVKEVAESIALFSFGQEAEEAIITAIVEAVA